VANDLHLPRLVTSARASIPRIAMVFPMRIAPAIAQPLSIE
jgi:hypothetical protein